MYTIYTRSINDLKKLGYTILTHTYIPYGYLTVLQCANWKPWPIYNMNYDDLQRMLVFHAEIRELTRGYK